ncbi:MAG: hypothetical protein IT289_13460 [Oligoflexia bacterium]|nr:hypothetical protein [Oligoflexia bacterium]
MKTVKVKLFGGFKKFIPSGYLELQVQENCGVNLLKAEIQKHLESHSPEFLGSQLVFDSVLASDVEILNDNESIVECASLALLPPVCGG